MSTGACAQLDAVIVFCGGPPLTPRPLTYEELAEDRRAAEARAAQRIEEAKAQLIEEAKRAAAEVLRLWAVRPFEKAPSSELALTDVPPQCELAALQSTAQVMAEPVRRHAPPSLDTFTFAPGAPA